MKFSGEVRAGKLLIDPASLAIACNEYNGKRVILTIEPERARRSLSQNAYYHACITPIFAHILTQILHETEPDAEAVTNEEAHEALKKRFLGKKLVGGLEVVRSTTKLSTIGFSDFVELCRQLAAESGYYIPEPGSRDEVVA